MGVWHFSFSYLKHDSLEREAVGRNALSKSVIIILTTRLKSAVMISSPGNRVVVVPFFPGYAKPSERGRDAPWTRCA